MTHHIITQVKESLGGVEKGLGVLRGVEKGLGVLRGIFGVLRRIEGHLVGGIGGHLVERRGRLEGDCSMEGSLDHQKHCLKNKNKKTGCLTNGVRGWFSKLFA